MAVPKTENEQYLAQLLKWLKPGDTVYTVLTHVSRSGMSRHIRVILLKPDRASPNGGVRIIEPNYAVAGVLGYKLANRDGMVVGGCGMDMGFHVVYQLGKALWPNGTAKPHGRRNGEPDSDGGYALKHRWL
jgi:hypothetical protein